MKAITVYQPWASLIILGEKRYETRRWKTNYRGPIAIHAGKRNDLRNTVSMHQDNIFRKCFDRHGVDWRTLPIGAVLGTATLVDCLPMTDALIRAQSSQEWMIGEWKPGRFALRIEDVEMFDEPIPAQGFQRIWDWERP